MRAVKHYTLQVQQRWSEPIFFRMSHLHPNVINSDYFSKPLLLHASTVSIYIQLYITDYITTIYLFHFLLFFPKFHIALIFLPSYFIIL